MRTATDYLRKYPSARPSTLSFIEQRNAVVEQLRREIAENQKKRRRSWLFWIWRRA